MEWKDVAKAVGATAPILGTVIGGPLGTAVGGAVSSLIKIFGLSDKATPDEVHAAIAADPQASLKLALAEQDFQLKQKEQDIEILRIQLADIQSARQRESSVKDNVNKILAYSIVGAFIALAGATLLGWAKVESALAGTLVGYLSAKCEQVLAYYFGSSKGSDKKTDLLAKAEAIKSE